MRKVISPLKNPAWRWIRGPTWFQHIRDVDGEWKQTIDKHRDKNCWISDVDTFFLNVGGNELLSQKDNAIVCHSFQIFGQDSIVQSWGFMSDFEKRAAQLAVRFGGEWFLIEKADELNSEVADGPPFTSYTLSVKSRQGHKSATVYRK
ncbi:MAG: hypothetical protein Q8L24_02150 [bacterium]|nr:hypothetical protein [bacterium]